MSENNEKNVEKAKESQDASEEKKEELTVEQKLKETENKLLRSLAEIENQRRRFEKEIKDAFEFGSFNFAKESLAILDNLDRAKNAIKNDEVLKKNKDLERFLENISIIEKDLVTIFERNRITKINAKGEKFDPNLHQAMAEIEDENSELGTIVQEIQCGYMLGERLLRPALVGISKKKISKSEEKAEKKDKN
tara:strand:+ start:5400 stop:5978 length:579 start_codon:yes stop_codon:yes gene_type:complete